MPRYSLYPEETFRPMLNMHSGLSLDKESLSKLLNGPQLEAVTHEPGPQLILAGAGSGKTRVLTYKIAWLLREKNYRPHQVLAVTFTNKAAQEMRHRIELLLGYACRMPWMGTFHSICARLLRYHAPLLGFTSGFTIYDVDDQKRFLKKFLKAEGYGEGEGRISVDPVRHAFGKYKNQGLSPEEARLLAEDRHQEEISLLFMRYQAELRKNNAMDFDDLIYLAIRLLKSFPDVRATLAESYRYILVDEYQDTNKAQYQLISLLLGAHRNIVVVGDDDQSIYGWRGADIGNILSFRQDYADAHVTKLEQNYRSTSNILGVAGSVIRHNRNRMDKTIWTQNEAGEKVSLVEHDDELAEAAWVARSIRDNTRHKPGDIAIFYRTNAQSRVLEDELRRQRIPYLIVGGIRFYERKEVKDLLAYLRVLSNDRDGVSLARIVNVPRRGIGEKSMTQLADFAVRHDLTLYQTLERADETGVPAAMARKIKEFGALLKELKTFSRTESLPALIERTIERTGYKEHLEAEGTDEALERLENVEELVGAAQDYLQRNPDRGEANSEVLTDVAADYPADWDIPMGAGSAESLESRLGNEGMEGPESTQLDAFLQEISLISDADSLKAANDAVVLMTVHSAKGLEFPQVFVTGLEDGLFPLAREDEKDMEEERRLFYVAVTRARRDLYLSFARRRRRYGIVQESGGSRFFREVDPSFLRIEQTASKPKVWYREGEAESDAGEGTPDYEDYSQESEGFYRGCKVMHDKFGEGMIMSADGHGDAARVEVAFRDGSRRRLMVKFAKLRLVD